MNSITSKLDGAASPSVAAAFAAGIVYVWGEAIFRLIFTFFPDVPATYTLWSGRAGDIAAMWLTISVVAVVVFAVLSRLVWRGHDHVGSLRMWTIVLIVSAIAAPLIGEYGTPFGI